MMVSASIFEAACGYHAAGYSLIPCKRDKRPAIAWQKYTSSRATMDDLRGWFVDQRYQSIGLIGGNVSGNVVFIDLDGIPAVQLFAANFPHLCDNTLSVLTGSQKGIHLYIKVDEIPRNVNVRVPDVGGFEVRANRQYVIAPPSLHPSGYRYQVWRDHDIAHLSDINEIVDWMLSLRSDPQPQRNHHVVNRVGRSGGKTRYLNAVIDGELSRVQTAPVGGRNNALFYAALRLANFAAGGELDWQDIKMMLFESALATGMAQNEATRTIGSAYRIGSANPKTVPNG